MKTFFSFIARLPRLYTIIGAVVVVAVGAIGIHALTRSAAPTTDDTAGISHVQLASVATLSSQGGPLPVTGTVTSQSQATILAQTSGEVVSLSHQIGDHVTAGAIIGEFENSSQAAAVTQSEGAYEAAQAALAKATGTTAANSGITSTQAATAAANAETSLQAALGSAYASLDDAVHTKADALFSNPRSANPTLLPFTVPDSQLVVNIENERVPLEATLADAETNADGSGDVDARATALLSDARITSSFLGDMVEALSQAVPNNSISQATISADQTSLAAARTEVITAISSVTSAKNAYDAAVSGAQTAANSASSGTESDIAAAEANLKSAQGTLDAAQANLEKTIIRSPISGTIVSLPVTRGDYVSSFSQVAIVSNPGALYVDAYVTPDDAKTLAVGNVATIESSVPGVITFIAPALDPSTGKIEVKVGITGSQGALTDGEAVPLSLARTQTANVASGGAITIPIIALKILPTGASVFTVSASSTLVAVPVQLGSILGDRVVISSGLTPSMQIVTDARGLTSRETVIVDTSGAVQTPAATSTTS